MSLRATFQSLISLHQSEFPYELVRRDLVIPSDKKNIVTVTGIRRCGKSSLLKLVMNHLIESGIEKERILYVGFDDERFSEMTVDDFDEILQAYRDMFPEQSLEDVYMFFDEIQLIKGWDLFVLRVYKNYCKNIFITGSTAEMLSGEMASALRGYPDEYREQVLSFSEYLRFRDVSANRFSESGAAVLRNEFKQYCSEGGYPQVVLTPGQSEKTKLLQSYFNTMLFRDMMEHYGIKSPSATVKYFLKRVMANLTKPTSINNIYNEMKSAGMKVSKDYLYDWLNYACEIFLFDRVGRYSASYAKETSLPAKYYIADIGLRNAVLQPQSIDAGKSLENIVFRILKSGLAENDRIFFFSEGKECDFIIQRSESIDELVQVCWSLEVSDYERELGGLLAASEYTGCRNCRVITFDREDTMEYHGLTVRVSSVLNDLQAHQDQEHPSRSN